MAKQKKGIGVGGKIAMVAASVLALFGGYKYFTRNKKDNGNTKIQKSEQPDQEQQYQQQYEEQYNNGGGGSSSSSNYNPRPGAETIEEQTSIVQNPPPKPNPYANNIIQNLPKVNFQTVPKSKGNIIVKPKTIINPPPKTVNPSIKYIITKGNVKPIKQASNAASQTN